MAYKKLNATASGVNTLIAGEVDKQIIIYGLFFQTGAATTVTLRSGTNDLTGAMAFTTNSGFNLLNNSVPLFECGVGENFIMNLSGLLSVSCGGGIFYEIVGT